jgi:hypothetical protein
MAGLVEVPNEPEFEASSWGRAVDERSCRLPVEVRQAVAEWDSVRSAAHDCHPAYGCHAFACTEFGATRACYRVGDVVDWDALASSAYNWSFSVIEDGSDGLVSIECLDGSGTRLYRHVDFNEEWAGSALAGIPPVLPLSSSVSSEQIDRASRLSMPTEPEIANSMLRALVNDGVAAFPVPLLSHGEVHLPSLQLGNLPIANMPIGNFRSETSDRKLPIGTSDRNFLRQVEALKIHCDEYFKSSQGQAPQGTHGSEHVKEVQGVGLYEDPTTPGYDGKS